MTSPLTVATRRLTDIEFVTPTAAVACGDAIELLGLIPDSSVALILTSPPYNVGKSYERKMKPEDYVGWCATWLSELARVCSPEGSVWLNLGFTHVPNRGTAVPIPYLIWEHLDLFLIQEVVWYFRAGVACRRRFSPRNEKLLWLVKNPASYVFDLDAVRDPGVRYPGQRRKGRLRCNPAGKNPTDVWEIPRVTGGRRAAEWVAHPTQMPLALAERIIRTSSRTGDLVLDPFSGSGTTAMASLRCGRSALLLEQDSGYVALARERIVAYSQQG